jgi:Bacterial Ig-like domain (group 3)
VTFKDGGSTLGTGTLDGSGRATFTVSRLSIGSHSITAIYSGDFAATSMNRFELMAILLLRGHHQLRCSCRDQQQS